MALNFITVSKKGQNDYKLIPIIEEASEYPQKLKILKATFSWFMVLLFD